jgi:hypothetical protein
MLHKIQFKIQLVQLLKLKNKNKINIHKWVYLLLEIFILFI